MNQENKDAIKDFLRWLQFNDFSKGLKEFATPVECMGHTGEAFKSIRISARLLEDRVEWNPND